MTGIVGTVLAPILQEKEEVFCIVRNAKNRINGEYLNGIVANNIIEGDIQKSLCGLSAKDYNKLKDKNIEKIVHLAGLLKFDEELSSEIWSVNYSGTQNVIDLAKKLNIREIHHASTAYALGKPRNPYESSKLAAENLIKNSGKCFSIYRISIVVGNSNTGEISAFDGIYGFISVLYRAYNRYKFNGNMRIYIDCSFQSTMNIIPIDSVVYAFVKLFEKQSLGKTFYITHPKPPKVIWVIKQAFEFLKIDGIKYNDYTQSQPSQSDRLLKILQKGVNKQLSRYRPYATEEKQFSLETTIDALKEEYKEPPLITSEILQRLLQYAISKNFGKPK